MTKPKNKGKAPAKAATPRKRKAADAQDEPAPKRATPARTARKGAQAPEEDEPPANDETAGEEHAAEQSARGSSAGTAKSQAAQSEALTQLASRAAPSPPHLPGEDSDEPREFDDVGSLHTSDDEESDEHNPKNGSGCKRGPRNEVCCLTCVPRLFKRAIQYCSRQKGGGARCYPCGCRNKKCEKAPPHMYAELRNFQRLLLADRARGDDTPAALAHFALKQSIAEYRKSVATGTPCPPSAFNIAEAERAAALPAPVVPAAPTPGVEVAINNLAQRFDAFQNIMLQFMDRVAPPPGPPGPSA